MGNKNSQIKKKNHFENTIPTHGKDHTKLLEQLFFNRNYQRPIFKESVFPNSNDDENFSKPVPNELILKIYSFLPIMEIPKVMVTCKLHYSILNSSIYWKSKLKSIQNGEFIKEKDFKKQVYDFLSPKTTKINYTDILLMKLIGRGGSESTLYLGELVTKESKEHKKIIFCVSKFKNIMVDTEKTRKEFVQKFKNILILSKRYDNLFFKVLGMSFQMPRIGIIIEKQSGYENFFSFLEEGYIFSINEKYDIIEQLLLILQLQTYSGSSLYDLNLYYSQKESKLKALPCSVGIKIPKRAIFKEVAALIINFYSKVPNQFQQAKDIPDDFELEIEKENPYFNRIIKLFKEITNEQSNSNISNLLSIWKGTI